MRPTRRIDASPPRAESDDEALLFVAQIVVGVGAGLVVRSIVADRLIGDMLGFAAMCAAQYPFARRTWAADVSIRTYWTGVFVGAVIAAGVRVAFQ